MAKFEEPPVVPLENTNDVVHRRQLAMRANAAAVSRDGVGRLLYPITDNEESAGVTPVNFYYPPGDVRRYGLEPTQGALVGQAGMTFNLYVDPNGDDSNNGSQSAPFKTIQRAVRAWQQHSGALQGTWIVNLAEGTYTETITVNSRTRTGWPVDIKGPPVSNSAGNDAVITFATDSASGTFSTSETVTGGNSGATGTVSAVATGYIAVTITSGSFEVGETVTGGTSGATCVVRAVKPVPRAVIQPANVSDTILTVSEGRSWYRLENIRFTGATSGRAVTLNGGVRMGMTNVHIDNCLGGVLYQHGSMLSVSGGIWIGLGKGVGGTGWFGLYACTHSSTATSAATSLEIRSYNEGMQPSEGCEGHLDGIVVRDCTTGVRLGRGCGPCNTDNMTIELCDTGLVAANSTWYNNDINFGTGADANTINVQTLGSAPEYDYRCLDYSSRTLRLMESQYSIVHTGSTTATTIYTSPPIRAWMVSRAGDSSRFEMLMRPTLTSGTCVVTLAIDDGSTLDPMCSITLPNGAGDTWVQAIVHFSAASAQRAFIAALPHGGTVLCNESTGAIALKNTQANILVRLTLSDASDRVNTRVLEYHTTLGG